MDIAVHPDRQRQGIGSEVFGSVLAAAGTANRPVRHSAVFGTSALRWLAKAGFVDTGGDALYRQLVWRREPKIEQVVAEAEGFEPPRLLTPGRFQGGFLRPLGHASARKSIGRPTPRRSRDPDPAQRSNRGSMTDSTATPSGPRSTQYAEHPGRSATASTISVPRYTSPTPSSVA